MKNFYKGKGREPGEEYSQETNITRWFKTCYDSIAIGMVYTSHTAARQQRVFNWAIVNNSTLA